MVEYIRENDTLFAVIIRNCFNEQGVHFISAPDEPLQVGVQLHPKNHRILPHIHKEYERNITYTQEVIHVEYGEVEVLFFQDDKVVATARLYEGDTIVLIKGGHGFNVIQDAKLIEVKQGPYLSQTEDKMFIMEKQR